MENTHQFPLKRRRLPGVAVALAMLNPLVSMLYVGRPIRAALYFGFELLALAGTVLLAMRGLWPAGVSWMAIIPVTRGICMVDGYRIARAHATGFSGPWFTKWYGLTVVAASFIVLAIAFRTFLFEPFRQPSGSMLPTLVENDQFFVSKRAFRDALPQRGNLIVFRVPATELFYVKRVVGLPGDVVDYEGSSRRLTINGTPAPVELLGEYADDPQYRLARENLDGVQHMVALMSGLQSAGGTFLVPDGHYFVLGDNRDNSQDSRFASIGFIPAENIRGKITLIWWNTDNPQRAGIVPE